MTKELIYKPFGQLLSYVIDNRGKTCPTADVGRPLIATNCIRNENLYPVYEKVRYVSDEVYKNWFRGHPKPGDMIFVTKGTPGRVCWVPDPVGFCIAQDMVAIRADEIKVYPKYLFAALRSKIIKDKIENLHVGSLIPHFKKGDFNNLKIPIPDTARQKFIGDYYFTLSLKIDLLYRQNKTLEALAETLFRQWFVEEADEGWKSGKVEDLFILQRGFDLPSQNRSEGQYPILSASGITGYHDEYRVQGPGVTTGRSGLLGKVFYVPGNFWPLNTSLFIVEYRSATPLFSYFFLKTLDLTLLNGGSAVPTLNRNDVHAISIDLPPKRRIDEFEEVSKTYFEKITLNIHQIHTLTRLRDAVLPKLMSGEVRVESSKMESAAAD